LEKGSGWKAKQEVRQVRNAGESSGRLEELVGLLNGHLQKWHIVSMADAKARRRISALAERDSQQSRLA
jgi:hypothetical protein